jgi:hypothetical protein
MSFAKVDKREMGMKAVGLDRAALVALVLAEAKEQGFEPSKSQIRYRVGRYKKAAELVTDQLSQSSGAEGDDEEDLGPVGLGLRVSKARGCKECVDLIAAVRTRYLEKLQETPQ